MSDSVTDSFTRTLHYVLATVLAGGAVLGSSTGIAAETGVLDSTCVHESFIAFMTTLMTGERGIEAE